MLEPTTPAPCTTMSAFMRAPLSCDDDRMRKLALVMLFAGCASRPDVAPVPASLPAPPPLEMSEGVRAQREQELATARAAYDASPSDAEAIIWLGRRSASLGRYQAAIGRFTAGA